MTKDKFLALLKEKKDLSQIDLLGQNIEGLKSNLLHFKKNQVIFNINSLSKSIYYIISGEVMTSTKDKIKVYNENEFFGLESLKKCKAREYTAISVKTSTLLELIIHEEEKLKFGSSVSDLSKTESLTNRAKETPDIQHLDIKRNYNVHFDTAKYDEMIIVFVNLQKATLTASKSFMNYLSEIIDGGEKKIIIDLRTCSLIDSTFLGVLVKSLKTAKSAGADIVLVYNKENPSTLFMITYMDKVFKTYKDLEEAVAHFKQ